MRKIFFILFYLLFVTSTAWAVQMYKIDQTDQTHRMDQMDHNSSKECAVCHYEWMPEFVYDLKGTDIATYQGEKVVATEKMCFSCHNGTVGDSRIRIWSGDMHKLADKIPDDMKVPENLPLDGGRINCRTCHTAHATGDPKAEGIEKGVFLRMENTDSQLCQACHKALSKSQHPSHYRKIPEKDVAAIKKKLSALGARLGSQNQMVCQSCHTPHSPRDKALLIYPVDDSKLCSICHTGKVDPDNALYIKGMLNHPIDIRHDNPQQVAKVKKAGGVYGTQDEVICLTCHSPHKGKTDALLIENSAGSQLCITCHDNKKAVFNGKHDMHNVKGFRTKEGKTAQEKGTCQSCHAPHGWSLELPASDADMLSAGCLSCHQEGGFAAKKILSAERFNHPVGKQIKDTMNSGELPLFPSEKGVKKVAKNLDDHIAKSEAGNMVTCATCHDVHAGSRNFLRTEAENGSLCLTCHTEKKMIEKTVHGRQKLARSCLSCHRIHNCANKRLLNLSENDGCLECHGKGGRTQNHVVDLKHSHPVNVQVKNRLKTPFKSTPDGRLACVSCHDPHKPGRAGNMQKDFQKDFLRGAYSGKDAFCTACHETQKEIIGSDHDNRKKNTDSVCGQCHSVHNALTANNIMNVQYSYKDKDDSCRACHRKNGSAGKKVISGGHKVGRIEKVKKYRKYLLNGGKDGFLHCSSCHTVHNNGPRKGMEGTIRNSFLDRNLSKKGNFCFGCHDDKTALAASKHNVTNFKMQTQRSEVFKVQGDTCGVCHKVHNSGYYLFEKSLGRDEQKICTSCHSKKGLASSTSIATSHKINIKLKKDRDVYLHDGRMVCVTCHEPHAKNRGMLRDPDKQNLCIVCHEDQKTVKFSDHNLANVTYLKSETVRKAKDNVCVACHKPHNFHKDNRLMWAFDPQKNILFGEKSAFAIRMCTDCHTEEGLGRKKIPEVFTHGKIFKILPSNVKKSVAQYLFDENGVSSANGSITCQSCHKPHDRKKGLGIGTAGGKAKASNSFLKQIAKEQFCAKCHGMAQSEELFAKFHDRKFRESRNKKQDKAQVLRNLMIIQMNLKKIQND